MKNFAQNNLVPLSVVGGATLATPFISCAITGFSLKNFGLGVIGSLLATVSAVGAAALDCDFGAEIYEKKYIIVKMAIFKLRLNMECQQLH